VASKQPFSNTAFIDCIRAYLPAEARVRETEFDGNLGKLVPISELNENTFYHFDADALSALCYAIEDAALEEANGRVLAAMQDLRLFASSRERYEQLAATIDGVEVVGTGAAPRVRRIKFISDAKQTCKDYWMVLYEGRRLQAMVVCRQANKARLFEDRQFVGFYTFRPRLVALMRDEFLSLAAGRCAVWREFMRLHALDEAAKQIKREFLREREALDAAMRRLQFDGKRYRPVHFASDLEKGLSRLHQWKKRLPEMVARAQAD
jgi:DICT domain-containing protein